MKRIKKKKKKGKKSVVKPSIPATSTLVVGLSGSGKTRYAVERSKILAGSDGVIAVINGDIADYVPVSRFRHTDLDRLTSLKKEIVVILDDLNCPNGREFRKIKRFLTYARRHEFCNIIAVVHGVQQNNLSSLTFMFEKVLFTTGPANAYNFIRYAQLTAKDIWPDSESARVYFGKFLKSGADYLHFDSSKRVATWQNLDGSLVEEKEEKKLGEEGIMRYAEKYLISEQNQGGLTLLNFLLCENDLQDMFTGKGFEIQASGGGKIYSVNILDLLSICSAASGKIPTAAEREVFGAIARHTSIPRSLILNPAMNHLVDQPKKK